LSGRIDLGGAHVPEGVIAAIAEVLESGWLGQGPRVEEFEHAFALYCGGEHPVAVNCGTSALHLAVRLLNLEPGSEIITTPNTFIATNQVILYEGMVPVFADIEPHTGNASVASMEESITSRTRALMLTHYAGYPVDLDAAYALAHKHGLQVIEDCAHAAGASYRGRRIGSSPNSLQAFSFQATKNLSAVDGGLLFTRSEEEAQRARRLRWMGIDSSTHERTASTTIANAYTVQESGFRYAMSDLNAAIALVQLPQLDIGNARRAQIAERYANAFQSLQAIETLQYEEQRRSSFHLFPVLCNDRDILAARLREKGIVTGVHYARNDHYPIFDRPGVSPLELPNTQSYAKRVITLPMHLGLSDEDVDRVIEAVGEAVSGAVSDVSATL